GVGVGGWVGGGGAGWRTVCLHTLSLPAACPTWVCLAGAGRPDGAPALGSAATHTRSGLGGLAGRGLAVR
ncbi:urea amidolyase, partial [Methylobacterium radiotolerans]